MENQPTTSATAVESAPVAVDSTYHLKWIPWNSGKIPIVMQSKNGPCPLIATMNVLLLREKVKLPSMLEQITADQLLTYLGECIMDCMSAEIQNDQNAVLNLEQNIHDAMEILPKLNTGLDVNIRFTGIQDFEYTPECIVFDLLRIPLYHGWLSDPSLEELRNSIGTQSYNQLVDNIITNKTSNDPETMAKVLMAEEFLERTASQLTEHGLNELRSQIKDNEIDHGYLTEDNIIWEILDNIEGAGRFFDSNFQLSEITNKQVSEFQALDQRQQQLENDFLMALSLREEEKLTDPRAGTGVGNDMPIGASASSKQEDDFELAKRLQEEENRIYEEMTRESQANTDRALVPVETEATNPIEIASSDPRAQNNDLSGSSQPSLADTNRSWARLVADGHSTTLPEMPKPTIASIGQLDGVGQFNEATCQTNRTTHTAPSTWNNEPISELQQQHQLGPNQTPFSSTSHSADTRPAPSVEQRQQQPQTRPPSSTNRRGRSDKNSRDINCVVN